MVQPVMLLFGMPESHTGKEFQVLAIHQYSYMLPVAGASIEKNAGRKKKKSMPGPCHPIIHVGDPDRITTKPIPSCHQHPGSKLTGRGHSSLHQHCDLVDEAVTHKAGIPYWALVCNLANSFPNELRDNALRKQ